MYTCKPGADVRARKPAFMISSFKKANAAFDRLLGGRLWLKIVVALVAGIGVGILMGPDVELIENERTRSLVANWLAFPGELFLQLIKMIVIPLVVSSIIVGVISSGDPGFLRKFGPRILLYFVLTTTISTTIGFALALNIRPGDYVNSSNLPEVTNADVPQAASGDIWVNLPRDIARILPQNPLEAMSTSEMLGVVVFTMLIAVAILSLSKRQIEGAQKTFGSILEVSMVVVSWAMALVPIAVFGLMVKVTSQIGMESLLGLGVYMLTVLGGLLCMAVIYFIIVAVFTKHKLGHFVRSIRELQILAFSTSSSAAVMPLNMQTAENKLGVRPAISQFLIPVGATVNMDGTALYQVVATVFLAQVYSIDISLVQMVMVVAITVGASIGTPAAPGIGIVVLATILASVGIPGEGIAMILGVDRLLDMCRTTVNVTGDITATTFFNDRFAHLFDELPSEPPSIEAAGAEV